MLQKEQLTNIFRCFHLSAKYDNYQCATFRFVFMQSTHSSITAAHNAFLCIYRYPGELLRSVHEAWCFRVGGLHFTCYIEIVIKIGCCSCCCCVVLSAQFASNTKPSWPSCLDFINNVLSRPVRRTYREAQVYQAASDTRMKNHKSEWSPVICLEDAVQF